MLRIDLITLFPQMLALASDYGINKRAIDKKLVALQSWNPRDYTGDKSHTVDDKPFGGGPGMVMKYKPIKDAICAAKIHNPNAPVIYLSPQGRKLDQESVTILSKLDGIILLAGRYEGIDQRLINTIVDEEWSIGDYVLSGGELPALVMIDAIIRLLPGALGNPQSAMQDSFHNGLLDYPQYTRPVSIDGYTVPDVLISGNHAAIADWRNKQAYKHTQIKRPDLVPPGKLKDKKEPPYPTGSCDEKKQH